MAAMNQHIYATPNVFQVFSKRYIHRHGREVTFIVHSSVEMDGAVQRPSYARAAMDAAIIVTNNTVVYAVSILSVHISFFHRWDYINKC